LPDYRPFHLPECPARDPDVNVDWLRMQDDGSVVITRICTCPPERFGPGSKPIYDPGDDGKAGGPGDPPSGGQGRCQMMTCEFCGRTDPPGGVRELAQVSNPVKYATVCTRRAACYLAAFRAVFRHR
jgi:hypothetical protein